MSFFSCNFEGDKIPDFLSWKIGEKPDGVKVQTGSLQIEPNYKTDFWRNTYYEPVLQAYNGHVLGLGMSEQNFVAETRFAFNASIKFDHAGIFIGVDHTTWLKAGVELVDGKTWQSVVVTRNDYSDWSKARLPWPDNTDICLKVYRQGCSYVIEVSDNDGKSYDFVRIAHMPTTGPVTAGIMCCRPSSVEGAGAGIAPKGVCVDFKYFNILENKGYDHSA
uniref:regulation of enolase protein 1-like n=1 Tax=Styela clava TaxID=7725 RepID=UPI00193AD221|nr:regulation of enolase protein 1-like [Styela clava]